MNDFINSLFADVNASTVIPDCDSKIINEAIILDEFNGNMDSLIKVYNKLGRYASRDGLLNENAETDIKLRSFDDSNCADNAAILAIAKQSGCKEYDVYTKAVLLMSACMDKMRELYGNIAKEKVEEHKEELMSNEKIANAVEEVKEEQEPTSNN